LLIFLIIALFCRLYAKACEFNSLYNYILSKIAAAIAKFFSSSEFEALSSCWESLQRKGAENGFFFSFWILLHLSHFKAKNTREMKKQKPCSKFCLVFSLSSILFVVSQTKKEKLTKFCLEPWIGAFGSFFWGFTFSHGIYFAFVESESLWQLSYENEYKAKANFFVLMKTLETHHFLLLKNFFFDVTSIFHLFVVFFRMNFIFSLYFFFVY